MDLAIWTCYLCGKGGNVGDKCSNPISWCNVVDSTLRKVQPPDMISPVQNVWFDLIKAGRKTVEGRTGHPGKYDNFVGKRTTLRGSDGGDIVRLVKAVRHYDTLVSYIQGEGWETIAPHTGSNKDAFAAYMDILMDDGSLVFSLERVKKRGGMNAIELEM